MALLYQDRFLRATKLPERITCVVVRLLGLNYPLTDRNGSGTMSFTGRCTLRPERRMRRSNFEERA